MKKVLSIIALCLIAVLAGTIIVFSCVDKSYNLNLTKPDYIEISINNSNAKESYYSNGDEEHKAVYVKVMKLYDESYKQKIMSGIFSGTIFSKPVIVRNGQSISNILSNGTFIVFNYADEQTLKLNGKDYTYTYSGGSTDSNIKYKTLYVEVKDTDSVTTFNIYVKNISSDYSYYRYSVQGKQADLYDYLQKLGK